MDILFTRIKILLVEYLMFFPNRKETIDMHYLSTKQPADKWGISSRPVQQLYN